MWNTFIHFDYSTYFFHSCPGRKPDLGSGLLWMIQVSMSIPAADEMSVKALPLMGCISATSLPLETKRIQETTCHILQEII